MSSKVITVESLYVSSVEEAIQHITFSAEREQVNAISGRAYTKVNQLLLIASQSANKFSSNKWYSKEQLKDTGIIIKNLQKGVQLFTSKIIDDETRTYTDTITGEVKNYKIKKYSYYTVFNEEQLIFPTEANK